MWPASGYYPVPVDAAVETAQDIAFDVRNIANHVSAIELGLCLNPKIC